MVVERESDSLIVVCAGGHASEIASYVRELRSLGQSITIHGFVDDYRFDTSFEGAPILGRVEHLGEFLEVRHEFRFIYLTAIRDNRARAEVVRRIEAYGSTNLVPWTFRHPTAVVGDAVEIGVGTFIAPGAVITTNVSIGEHCILNIGCSVSHDSTIHSFVNIDSGVTIGRRVTLGTGCSIGTGATIADNVQVGEWSVVGAGAVVDDDVPARVTVAGVPARIIQRHGRGIRHSRLAG